MVKHIVAWNFKTEAEGKTKQENMEWVREHLFALLPVIGEIKKMEIGFDISHTDMSADLVLITEFESTEELKIYAEHPEHLKVSAYVRKVIECRKVIDFEF